MREKNTFTIFGGTGDLTFRKLLPALYNMEMTGSNPFDTQIVIIGPAGLYQHSLSGTGQGLGGKIRKASFQGRCVPANG